MPKITKARGATDARTAGPAPVGEAVEHPADGTLSPEITSDGTGEALPPIEAPTNDTERAAEAEAAGLSEGDVAGLSDDEVAAVATAAEDERKAKPKRAGGTRKRASGARKSTG